MMNDTYGSKARTNCEFVIDKEAKRVFIRTLEDISPLTEMYVSYGDEYW